MAGYIVPTELHSNFQSSLQKAAMTNSDGKLRKLAWLLSLALALNSSHSFEQSRRAFVFPPLIKWHVFIANGLSTSKDPISVHCRSKDDDLGVHNVFPGMNLTWSFRTNVFHSTLFWCYVGNQQMFSELEVFWEDKRLFEKCGWKNCVWIAKDDGIYIKDFSNGVDVFWNPWER